MKRLADSIAIVSWPKLDGLKPSSLGIVLLLSLVNAATAISPLDPAAVRMAADYSARHRGVSFLAIQDGRTLLEQNAKTAHKIYSGTKAFWDLAALAAAEDGLLHLDERVADTIMSWRSDPRKAQVTIRQLLDFDSGLEPSFSCMKLNQATVTQPRYAHGWWQSREARLFMDRLRSRFSIKC